MKVCELFLYTSRLLSDLLKRQRSKDELLLLRCEGQVFVDRINEMLFERITQYKILIEGYEKAYDEPKLPKNKQYSQE